VINHKFKKFIFLVALFFHVLPMGRGQTWTSPVLLAFGKEEGKRPEVRQEVKTEAPIAADKAKTESQPLPYAELVRRNIFSPERKEFLSSPADGTKKPLVRPQVVLYGVTIAGDFKSATFVQIGRPLRKGEREMVTLKIGESIGEYKLAKVLPDRITLEAEGDSFEVLLYDSARPKQRVAIKTESSSATITSALPGPAVAPSTPTTSPSVQGITSPGQARVTPPTTTSSGTSPIVTPGSSATTPSPTPSTSTPYPYFPRRGGRIISSNPEIPTPPQNPQTQQGGF